MLQEKIYDATKQECRENFKTFKKVQYWLYDVHFILETDSNIFVFQLNGIGTDILEALVMR